jgi:tetratricopeptide (TPR) repeat protein
MSEWFRNTTWDESIEAAFNAKLTRSRTQQAQYLRIQGSLLKESHPEAALGLLRRCIDLGDEFYLAAAHLDAAQAHYSLGDVDQSLASLEAAMEQEARYPLVRTSARFDYLMLVALHERKERYDAALALLDLPDLALFPAMEFQREAARAVILATHGRHEEARAAARLAMAAEAVRTGWIPGYPEVGVLPDGTNPLSARVREIALFSAD